DGIRDFHVTGVQTCALPICRGRRPGARHGGRIRARVRLHAVPSGTRHPVAGAHRRPIAGGNPLTPKPYTHKDAVAYRPLDWTGIRPPAFAKVPEHVAIVMDGNGRWANRRGLTRIQGHKAGEEVLLDVVAGAI